VSFLVVLGGRRRGRGGNGTLAVIPPGVVKRDVFAPEKNGFPSPFVSFNILNVLPHPA
jgi:hypothetical protein